MSLLVHAYSTNKSFIFFLRVGVFLYSFVGWTRFFWIIFLFVFSLVFWAYKPRHKNWCCWVVFFNTYLSCVQQSADLNQREYLESVIFSCLSIRRGWNLTALMIFLNTQRLALLCALHRCPLSHSVRTRRYDSIRVCQREVDELIYQFEANLTVNQTSEQVYTQTRFFNFGVCNNSDPV